MPKTTSKTTKIIKTAKTTSAASNRSDRVAAAQAISPEERQRMIAEAAYLLAERRGFQGGNSVEDWLQAEQEINYRLLTPAQQKQEKLAYDKLHKSARRILDEASEKLNPEVIRSALSQAVMQLKQIGEYTADTVDRMAASVERDLVEAARRISSR